MARMSDDAAPPESLLPYDIWAEEALREVAIRALEHAAAHGLPAEHHYYLTSLTPLENPAEEGERLLEIARGHWAIENRLHHPKDRSMGEDAQQAKLGASMLARLRGLALGLLRLFPGSSTRMRQIAVAADLLDAVRRLGIA